MTIYRLGREAIFPDPREAEPDGLLAVGGDLRPERLLAAYALGIFPWYEKPPILWFSPDPRMVLVPARTHVSRRLRRVLKRGVFELRFDTAFGSVIRACAKVRRGRFRGTWITRDMIDAYTQLHELGYAHSAEAWAKGELVGGAYGVALGAAFFGESMFHLSSDASKAALVALAWHLDDWGFTLIDCQQHTAHMERFGATPWPRARFLAALEEALQAPTRRSKWSLSKELLLTGLARS